MSRRPTALRQRLGRVLVAQEGTTTVEYGILAAAIGLVLVATGPALADSMLSLLNDIVDGMVG